MYTELSRVKFYDNLYCIEEFKKSVIKVNKDALLEQEHLKQNDLFSIIREMLFPVMQSQSLLIMCDHFQEM